MRQIFFLLIGVLLAFNMQAQQPAKVTLDEIFTSGNYIYAQADADEKSEAVALAKMVLVQEINKEIQHTGKTLQLNGLMPYLGTYDYLRNNKYIVIAYIKKDKLEKLFSSVPVSMPEPKPDPVNVVPDDTPTEQLQQQQAVLSIPNSVQLTVTDIQNATIAQKINANTSVLLTELNLAYSENRLPVLKTMVKNHSLNKEGNDALLSVWETAGAFCCSQSRIVVRGYYSQSDGYQVRPIWIHYKNEKVREDSPGVLVVEFDALGNIADIHPPLSHQNYWAIMQSENNDVKDLTNRAKILSFVENFRTAYIRKDIDWLAKIYSEDALIITGKVIRKSKAVENISYGNLSQDEIKYQVQTKPEYISNLKKVFNGNKRIDLQFHDIRVTQHPKYPQIYGVLLKQDWTNWKTESTKGYNDEGYLFLMVDFKDGNTNNMEVHVRTWQPDKLNGKPLSEDEIFGLGNFDVR